jgi:GNAT superfamily N-acetyltransferase
VDRQAALTAFNAQIRQHPVPDVPHGWVERDDRIVRRGGPAWSGVTWSELDELTADAVIAAQITRFAALGTRWEWKHYSYDTPQDLPERLVAAGLTREPPEALLVAALAEVTLEAPPPPGVELRPVVDQPGVQALVSVHDQVFGEDHADLGNALLAELAHGSDRTAAVVAWAGATPVAAARVEFHPGTEFASLWGGGTLPGWRRRGVFRSLVGYRAALVSARGVRYLQVDASPESRPILERLGFIQLATTTPFVHLGRR